MSARVWTFLFKINWLRGENEGSVYHKIHVLSKQKTKQRKVLWEGSIVITEAASDLRQSSVSKLRNFETPADR